jgi:hypothetical protein
MESETLNNIKAYRRKALTDLLEQCTVLQIKLFKLMYYSVETIPDEKIDWAIRQCENTIKSNKKK